MLHPNQFQVNEAWIVFKLNHVPISTAADGDFNLIALMDAASCFILSNDLIPANATEPSNIEAERLLKKGFAHRQQLPKTLYIPTKLPADIFAAEAERQGITVVRISEDQLLPCIGEAKDGFKARFGRKKTREIN